MKIQSTLMDKTQNFSGVSLQNSVGALNILETWITPHELYGPIQACRSVMNLDVVDSQFEPDY